MRFGRPGQRKRVSRSWFAPIVSLDWRRGGTIKSRYKIGAKIGERNTVISEIVDYIPHQQITLKDNLIFLLSYGKSQGWIKNISDDFMFGLIADGGDIFTTVQFDNAGSNKTKVTIYITGYSVGDEWDIRTRDTISANQWTYSKLIDRFETGPVDWKNVN